MKKIFAIITCSLYFVGFSQTKQDSTKSIKLDEVVINSQRFAKSKRKVTQQVESISKKEIEFNNYQTSADVLGNSGILAIQKSQQGGGSPIIRGFEASRILILVDGVRMNNLIFRSGHLQNIITVDKNALEKVDVLFGPSSTIYGSDALGGAIYLQTKNAKLLSENGNKVFSGSIITNYSAVNDSKSNYIDLNFADKKWASLSTFSFNDYGDLKMGKNKNGSNDFFGERPFYVETINGVDKIVANNDKYLQKFSGYKQYNFMQKIVFQQNEATNHSLNLHYSTSSDVPRYDRLTDKNSSGNLNSAVWKYGPQKRFLSIYKLTKDKVFLNSDLNLNLSYQNVEESRINRNFGNLNEKSRIENVAVFALNSDFKTKIGTADFIYGMDIYYDDLKSTAFQENINTGVISNLDTRYPDGKNNTLKTEGFVYLSNNLNTTTSYNASIRAGYTNLKSEIKTNYLNLPFTTIDQKNATYSGALGIVNNPNQNSKIAFNLASAYRVPNIDDLSKIFESQPGTLIVPNKNLKPEKSVTADLSVTLWSGKKFQFENTLYITKLYDPIITDTFTYNGQSTILYEGQNSTVLANQNKGTATITGLFSTLKGYITKSVFGYGTFNYTRGRVNYDSNEQPLDHISPTYGKLGLKYESKAVNLDLYVLYNGKKDLKDYSTSGEDNLQYATSNGTPSWETYNLKGSLSLIKNITIFSGIENVLDTQYRTFASGINAGGRNIYLGGKYSF